MEFSPSKLIPTWLITKYVQGQAVARAMTEFIYVEVPGEYCGHDVQNSRALTLCFIVNSYSLQPKETSFFIPCFATLY